MGQRFRTGLKEGFLGQIPLHKGSDFRVAKLSGHIPVFLCKIDFEWRPPPPLPFGTQGYFCATTKQDPNRFRHVQTETGTFEENIDFCVEEDYLRPPPCLFKTITADCTAQRTPSKCLREPHTEGVAFRDRCRLSLHGREPGGEAVIHTTVGAAPPH